MDKDRFLSELKEALKKLPESECNDIIRDQEEFIRDAMASGRSEESVIKSLGDPQSLGQTLVAQSRITRAKNEESLSGKTRQTGSAIMAVLALAPLNFFILVGPVVAISSVLFAGWTTVFSLGAIVIAVTAGLIANIEQIPFATLGIIASFSGMLGFTGLVILSALILWALSKGCLNLFLNYLRWNVRFVQQHMKGA